MRQHIRGSDVYVLEDIVRILRALLSASAAYPAGDYRTGYLAALKALALALGADDPALWEANDDR